MTRVLLVTGASGGIGAATAKMAAERGWDRVIVHYNSDAKGARAVADAVTEKGTEAQVVQADVANPKDVARLMDVVHDGTPGHLGLVNNAGIVVPTGSLADLTPERVQQVFAVNVFGLVEVARQSVSVMREWGMGGGIVNVSSVSSRLGSPNLYIDYAGTKGAVDSMTLGMADELAPEGIRVNAIRPGLIATEIHAKGGEPDRLEAIGHTPPLGRPGTAEECAQSIHWLLSDEASYVTKSIMDVAGGR